MTTPPTPPDDTTVLPQPAPEPEPPRSAAPGGLRGAGLVAAAVGLVLLGAVPTYALTKAATDDDNPQTHRETHGQGEPNGRGEGRGERGHRQDEGGQGRGWSKTPPGQQGRIAPGLRPRMSQECLDALQGLRRDLAGEVTPETLPRLSDEQREELRSVCMPEGGTGEDEPAPQATPSPSATASP